ncbi:hypothetical protein J2W36_004092 [Variovorax ginsengisoli]|uniref:Uncharacterized protein n=1 Tax=Variovorax ginsengisoli TaxID=363844 RepID=A0ABT9SEM9_9BURK|nr:hypothetical protein [Variovorax ginsengisoli]
MRAALNADMAFSPLVTLWSGAVRSELSKSECHGRQRLHGRILGVQSHKIRQQGSNRAIYTLSARYFTRGSLMMGASACDRCNRLRVD